MIADVLSPCKEALPSLQCIGSTSGSAQTPQHRRITTRRGERVQAWRGYQSADPEFQRGRRHGYVLACRGTGQGVGFHALPDVDDGDR